MAKELRVGQTGELIFENHYDKFGAMPVRVSVYAGEVEMVYVSKAQAIALIDHLSTIYNLEDEHESPFVDSEDTAS